MFIITNGLYNNLKTPNLSGVIFFMGFYLVWFIIQYFKSVLCETERNEDNQLFKCIFKLYDHKEK